MRISSPSFPTIIVTINIFNDYYGMGYAYFQLTIRMEESKATHSSELPISIIYKKDAEKNLGVLHYGSTLAPTPIREKKADFKNGITLKIGETIHHIPKKDFNEIKDFNEQASIYRLFERNHGRRVTREDRFGRETYAYEPVHNDPTQPPSYTEAIRPIYISTETKKRLSNLRHKMHAYENSLNRKPEMSDEEDRQYNIVSKLRLQIDFILSDEGASPTLRQTHIETCLSETKKLITGSKKYFPHFFEICMKSYKTQEFLEKTQELMIKICSENPYTIDIEKKSTLPAYQP